ncbi:uncharacterized protein LOC110063029 [Orbicella faveolata]|uniref:uncharacterized protein LOC110063029 n=1 Tax=Orbicella faveolata TaxID=48498 RepID=UPI0009E5C2F2|nr:uncharacterized protein LOC110063029 [Orbicella faveolata]
MLQQWEVWLFIIRVVAFQLRARASMYDEFKVNWCRQRKWRLDWQSLQKPCQNLHYRRNNGKQYQRLKTSPEDSEIFDAQIRPAGEYSRFFVQSRTLGAERKTFGGDSWRVYLEGPSYLAGTVFDHNNGVYEVLFLIMEPGVYKINMILDYTLCDGVIDPPMDWFKNAHCSGKLKNVHLSNSLFSEMTGYINKPLLSATKRTITIPWRRLSESEIQNNMRAADNECDIQCNLMWDGFGRWVTGFKWKPYMDFTREDYTTLANQRKQHDHTVGRGVFWVYGDSLSYYFYMSVNSPMRRLCSSVFKECNNTYNWIYPKTLYELTETCGEVNLHVPRVLNFFRQVIERKDMDRDSALLLNAGAHYIKTTSFQSYQQVIVALISEIKKLYHGKPIWKSTTAIHGQTADIMGAFRRFTTNHRIQLYNAFANSAMCASGITVLDVYPISDSYPPGTKDGIHYNNEAFNPVIELLERYFSS